MLGIVTGLAAEARLARGLGGRVRAGGGTREGAQDAVEWLVGRGAGRLLSFGLAGGLDPALPAGTLLVPANVIAGGHELACDPDLVAALGGANVRAVFDAWQVVGSAEDKARIHAETGASALDMESGAAALLGRRLDIPFAVLRVVCDPAGRDLPPLALDALTAGGKIGIGRVLGGLLSGPGQLPALLRLAADARAANATLRAAVRRIGKL